MLSHDSSLTNPRTVQPPTLTTTDDDKYYTQSTSSSSLSSATALTSSSPSVAVSSSSTGALSSPNTANTVINVPSSLSASTVIPAKSPNGEPTVPTTTTTTTTAEEGIDDDDDDDNNNKYNNNDDDDDDEEDNESMSFLRCCGLRPEGTNLSIHPAIVCCPCGKRNGSTIIMYRVSPEARTWPKIWIIGPDWPCLCITFSLILIPSFAFFVFVASTMHIAVLIVSIFTLIVLLIALSMTAGSDPGYLKKQSPRSLEQMKQKLIQQGIQQYGPEQGPLILNNYSTCLYCHQLRAPGTSHCYDCDVCVEELDHHCPWTGKCIGKYNLRYFYGFLWSLSVHLVVVVGITFAWFITKASGLG